MITEAPHIASKNPARIKSANKADTDYKAEAIAASLLAHHHAAERIFIKRAGTSNRSCNKDILLFRHLYDNIDRFYFVIETYREGIYDYLPENIFHTLTLGGINKSNEDIIEEIQRQKKIEEDARLFFAPFEIESSYAELAALYYENSIDYKNSNNELLVILDELWPMVQQLDTEEAKTFIYLLPFFHAAKGNKHWFQKCMTAFLGYPVIVKDVAHIVEEASETDELLLSNATLGVNTLLSGNHFNGNINWQINIGPVQPADVHKFIAESSFTKILFALYDQCLPANVTAIQCCITTASELSFTLPPIIESENHLGFTTFI